MNRRKFFGGAVAGAAMLLGFGGKQGSAATHRRKKVLDEAMLSVRTIRWIDVNDRIPKPPRLTKSGYGYVGEETLIYQEGRGVECKKPFYFGLPPGIEERRKDWKSRGITHWAELPKGPRLA